MSLRYTILGFLSIRPLSGYDLKRAFDSSAKHFWSADQAAIYRTLGDLEVDGLVSHARVEQETRPDRKVFSATPSGLTALDAWLGAATLPPPRREPLLVKLFFASRLGPEVLRSLLLTELATVEGELERLRGVIAPMSERAAHADEATLAMMLGPLITLTYGVQFDVTYRDWLRGLLHAHEIGTLTVPHLLAELQDSLAPPGP